MRDLGGDFEEAFLKDIALTLEAYVREHAPEVVKKLYVLASPKNNYPLFEKLQENKKIEMMFVDPREALKDNKNIRIILAENVDVQRLIKKMSRPLSNRLAEEVIRDTLLLPDSVV